MGEKGLNYISNLGNEWMSEVCKTQKQKKPSVRKYVRLKLFHIEVLFNNSETTIHIYWHWTIK